MNEVVKQPRTRHVVLAFVTACLPLSTLAVAVSPPPDGGYPNGNTAEGTDALLTLTTGQDNTAVGDAALKNIKGGNENTAIGASALTTNGAGRFNTACGAFALASNIRGDRNVALGFAAGSNIDYASHNIAIGFEAGTHIAGSNNIDIGNIGGGLDFGIIRIGTVGVQYSTFVAGISEVTIPDGVTVTIDTKGHLGTLNSSVRFERDITPMGDASQVIYELNPVSFKFRSSNPEKREIPQFGLVAEQVAQVAPELVAYDESGQPYAVRYEAVNAMLLNEFLKEHQQLAGQAAAAAQMRQEFEAKLAQQQKQIAALMDALRQVQTSKSAGK